MRNIIFSLSLFVSYVKPQTSIDDANILLRGFNPYIGDPLNGLSYTGTKDSIFECGETTFNLTMNDQKFKLFTVPNCTVVLSKQLQEAYNAVITSEYEYELYVKATFVKENAVSVVAGQSEYKQYEKAEKYQIIAKMLISQYEIQLGSQTLTNPEYYSAPFLTSLNLLMIYVDKQKPNSDTSNLYSQFKSFIDLYGTHQIKRIYVGGKMERKDEIQKCQYNETIQNQMQFAMQQLFNANDILKSFAATDTCNKQKPKDSSSNDTEYNSCKEGTNVNLDQHIIEKYQEYFKTATTKKTGGNQNESNTYQWKKSLENQPSLIYFQASDIWLVMSGIQAKCADTPVKESIRKYCEKWDQNYTVLFDDFQKHWDNYIQQTYAITSPQNVDKLNCTQPTKMTSINLSINGILSILIILICF